MIFLMDGFPGSENEVITKNDGPVSGDCGCCAENVQSWRFSGLLSRIPPQPSWYHTLRGNRFGYLRGARHLLTYRLSWHWCYISRRNFTRIWLGHELFTNILCNIFRVDLSYSTCSLRVWFALSPYLIEEYCNWLNQVVKCNLWFPCWNLDVGYLIDAIINFRN